MTENTKVTVLLEIDKCNDCPFSTSTTRQVGLSTNNDYVIDWYCSKINDKISRGLDFGDSVEIPRVCPFNNVI